MSQLSGAFSLEVPIDRLAAALADPLALRLVSQLATNQLAELVAEKVAARLTEQRGQDVYERGEREPNLPPDSDPGGYAVGSRWAEGRT